MSTNRGSAVHVMGGSIRLSLVGCLAVTLFTVGLQTTSAAQAPGPGAWLEQATPTNWNQPGALVPTAPAPTSDTDPRCGSQERPPEAPEEDLVVTAGWRLFNAARVGWGLWIVDGLVGYDGMCRPLQFHTFVFAGGQLAGTISPTAMDSRTDGVGRVIDVLGPGEISAQFVRYAATDPLCCPSSTFNVQYGVDRTGVAPVLVPRSSTRSTAFGLQVN